MSRSSENLEARPNSNNMEKFFKYADILPGDYSISSLRSRIINSIIESISYNVKTHFGTEITISNFDAIREINSFLRERFPSIKKKQNTIEIKDLSGHNSTDKYMYLLEDKKVLLKYDSNTYILILTGRNYANQISKNKVRLYMGELDSIISCTMYFYFFGKHAYQCKKMIKDIEEKCYTVGEEEIAIYSMYGYKEDLAFRSVFQKVPARKLNTIFMEDGIVESICDHIDRYLSIEGTYSGRGIIYKTGILLYGEPGTGKSSLIKALAHKYKRDLIIADMTTFKYINIESLSQALNADDSKYILALEDIDCIIANREDENIDKEDKGIVNKLLQFLDSNNSPNDIIFIATTNHIELLDDALLREGRFDIQKCIGGVYESKARDMCKSFDLDDETTDLVINNIKTEYDIDLVTKSIRQSKLQNLILKNTGLNIKSEVIDEDAQFTDTGEVVYGKEDSHE